MIYFSIKSEFFGMKINLFCEELTSFFEADGKVTTM